MKLSFKFPINKIKNILEKIDIFKPNPNNTELGLNSAINSFIIGYTSFIIIDYKAFISIDLSNKISELVMLLISNQLNFKWFRNYDEFIEYYYFLDYEEGYYFVLIG